MAEKDERERRLEPPDDLRNRLPSQNRLNFHFGLYEIQRITIDDVTNEDNVAGSSAEDVDGLLLRLSSSIRRAFRPLSEVEGQHKPIDFGRTIACSGTQS